jgi:flagellar capping protein FliD
MNKDENAMRAILKGVSYLIDTAIQKAPFDKIVNGIIINKNDNTVDVIINGVSYINISSMVEMSNLSVNDTVKIMIPQNRMNKMFVLGKLIK